MLKLKTSIAVLLSLTLLVSAGCGNGKTRSATPEEAFENLKKAGAEKDSKKLVSVLSPKSVDQLASGMVAFCAMANFTLEATAATGSEDDDKTASAKKAVATAEKHGLSKEILKTVKPMSMPGDPSLNDVIAKISNKPAFCASMMDVIEETVGKTGSVFQGLEDATIKDITIDGDTAKGTATINGNEQIYEFRKIKGTWLVEMPDR